MPSPIRRDTPAIAPATRPARVAFDNFEVNTRSGELRKNGSRIRLQAQPFQLLLLLLRDAGEVVTRDEICRELWPADIFVDFEHSLAAAVNKLREALGDSAENPKYIETLPKRGYRFIGKIKPDAPVVIPTLESKETAALATVPVPTVKAHCGRWLATIALAAISVATFEHRWMIASDGIYFVSQSTPRTISFYDFSTQKTRDIFKTDRDLHDGISISPDGRYLLFSQLDESDSNIMLVSNFH